MESHQTPQPLGHPEPPQLCPQQPHGSAPSLSARRGYTGVPGRSWCQALHFPLHPVGQSLGMELGQLWAGSSSDRCSGLGAAHAAPLAPGCAQQGWGWGSRQISGPHSSWIKFPGGGVSLGGAPSFSGISQGEDSPSPAALGASQQLPTVLQVPPGAWSSQVGCAVPARSPQRFGGHKPTSAPSAGSVPWLQHENSGQDLSCPSAMLFSLFQKTKPRSPEGFI